MKLNAEAVWRMAYNVQLYSQKKSPPRGHTLWTTGPGLLRATGYDDYFALVDTLETEELKSPSLYLMDPGALSALEEALRGSKGAFVEFDDLPLQETTLDSPITEVLTQADQLCFPEGFLTPSSLREFALAPNRLRRLSLIKPGTYPIDCRTYSDSGRSFIAFKCGPTVRGAMACMDREKLLDMYEGDELWRS